MLNGWNVAVILEEGGYKKSKYWKMAVKCVDEVTHWAKDPFL